MVWIEHKDALYNLEKCFRISKDGDEEIVLEMEENNETLKFSSEEDRDELYDEIKDYLT